MKGFELSPEAIQALRASHRSVKVKKDAYKINAVILLGTGWTLQEVSEALLLDEATLTSYVQKYRQAGFRGLLATFHQGSQKKLNESQIESLCHELDHHIHLSTKSVCAFVQQTFSIDYTIGGMTDLLKALGYVYKKPKRIPGNPDNDAQEVFLEQYNAFMANKPADAAVFFVDAVHPVHNSMAAYGWMKKGEFRELSSNTGRSRLNIHGAMNAETLETTVITSEDNVNAHSTIELLKYLETLYPRASKIYVILDNARYHYCKAVQAYVTHSKIQLIFLPSYSPELNLIERLWRLFNKHILYNQYYATFVEFKKRCLGFFKHQSNYYEEIQSIMANGLADLV